MRVIPRVRCAVRVIAMLLIFAVAALLLHPVGQKAGEGARRTCCRLNLDKIGVALHNYHSVYKQFPPPATLDKDGKPLQSWRVLILPFLVEGNPSAEGDAARAIEQIRLDEPWDSRHNRPIMGDPRIGRYYHCPSDAETGAAVPAHTRCVTSYLMVVPPPRRSQPGLDSSDSEAEPGVTARVNLAGQELDLRDRVIVVEVRDSGIAWAEPRDICADEMSMRINDQRGSGVSSQHSGGAFVLFRSGCVAFLPDSTDPKLLARWLGLGGGGTKTKKGDRRAY